MFQINSKSSLRAALLLGAASAAVIGFSAPASADQIETVVVTGSLIPTPNATSNSPIQTVSAESIDLSGHPDVSEVLNTLPQIVPSLGAYSNNPGGGETTVNLRGLSPIRTLVLIDGRRVLPAGVTGEVDISQIPASLIDHVDVVTGGGSATYGSDAIAGVVNFVLKKDFEGFQAQARYGQEVTHGFVPEKELNFTMGVNSADGKANITLFGEFYKRNGLLQGEDSKFKLDNFFGSSTSPAGRVDGGQGFTPLPKGDATCGGPTSTYAFLTNGDPTGFCNLLAPTSDAKANALASQFETLDPQGDRYNFAPVNELVTPETRHTVHAMGHYDIFPGITAYASLHYSNSVNITQLAATPVTDGAALHFVVTPNPAAAGVGSQPTFLGAPNPFFGVPGFTSFISPAFQALIDTRATTINPDTGTPYGYSPFIVRWRSLAVGNRKDTFTTNVYEMTGGLKGQLPFVNGWDWDAYYQWGSGDQTSVAENNVLASHLGQAMLSCPVGSGKGCVPIDIFGQGNLTPDMANFIRATTVDATHYDRQLAHFETHGNVGDYWGEGAITAAFGAEWRRDSGTFRPDQAKQNFDILGFNPAKTSQGSYNVWELFTELRVPVLSDMPWVEYLGFDGGARFSRYSGSGDATTWKAGLEYQPTDDIRFRGMWQRALRAPNINELFNGGSDGFPAVTDPCDAPPASAAIQAACTAQFAAVGLTYNPATFQQSNSQSEAVTFGNPNLRPETSNTLTLGAVITPTFLPDVTASVDFWRISVKNFISVFDGGAQNVINDCINNFGGVGTRPFQELDPSFGNACDLVTRTGTGDLLFSIPNANVATGGPLKTSGLDLQINAQHDLADLLGQDGDWGAIDGSFAVNFLTEFFDPSCGCSLKGQVDFFGAAAGFNVSIRPNYKFTTRLGYTFGDWRAVLTWNETGMVRDTFGFGDQVRPYDKVDLAIRWNITDQYAADLIVDNLFNVNPPLGPYSGLGSINTIVEAYDPLGTQAFIGLTAKL